MDDKNRGTGRTQSKVRMALMAAMMGKRVLYITHSEAHARDCALIAFHMVQECEGIPGLPTIEVGSVAGKCLDFYIEGKMIGTLRFASMNDDAPAKLNSGQPEHLLYRAVYDHHVEYLRELERQRLEKVAAQEQILLLMKKHGWRTVYGVAPPTTGRRHFVRYDGGRE